MTLDELRHLNLRDVGNWPVLPKVLILLRLVVVILGGRRPARLEGPMGRAGGAQQEEGKLRGQYTREEGQGGQLRALRPAAQRRRAVLRRAGQAAAQQVRDGRAADRHQPGRAGSRPAVRAVPPAHAGKDGGVLRRTADHDQGHRHLSRHGRLRERRRAAPADRHPQRPRHHQQQGRRLSLDAEAKTFRYLDEEELAKQRAAANAKAKGKGRK